MNSESSFASTIAAKVITDLASKAASNLFTYLKKKHNKIAAEARINLGTAYQEYLTSIYEKYAKMKTLLYRHEPKDLYSFFEPLLISNGDIEVDTNNVHELMQKGNCLLITGSGGTGKSVMMKHFLLDCIKRNLFVPILIELRSFNGKKIDETLFIDHIYENLCALNFKIEKQYFIDSLDSDIYLFLFDGYDELSSDAVETISEAIRSFCAKYQRNHYIISSRPSLEFIGWQMFKEYRMMPMKKEQALSLIKRLEYDAVTKMKFYTALEDKLFDKYESFASIPLLLTIMLITYDYSGYIPENINNFFEQAFFALFYTHDSTKDGFKRAARSGLCYEEFKMIFSYFCFKTYFDDTFEFTPAKVMEYIKGAKSKFINQIAFESLDFLHDLTDYVCMLVSEGLNYKFSHRSFQEYFAAVYTAQLPDEILERFLCGHLRKTVKNSSYEYYEMLYQMQKPRFFKNVLYPELCHIRDLLYSNGHTIYAVLKEEFKHVSVVEEDGCMELCFATNNHHVGNLLTIAGKLLNFQFDDLESREKRMSHCESVILVKFKDKFRDDPFAHLSFQEIEEAGYYDELMEVMSYFRERIEYLMKCLKEYELSKINSDVDFDTLAACL